MIIADGPLPAGILGMLETHAPLHLACATLGLVEEGALDASTLRDLRDLAARGGGAWDLANGQEIGEAVYRMGAHLYKRFAHIPRCQVDIVDYGRLTLYRSVIERAIEKVIDELVMAQTTTEITVRWHSAHRGRWQPLGWKVCSMANASFHYLAKPNVAAEHSESRLYPTSVGCNHGARDCAGENPTYALDKLIHWGLWLSGSALFSALTLLAKK